MKEKYQQTILDAFGKCPGCNKDVELLYEHEKDNPPLCDDCWEKLTVNPGDCWWER